MDPREVTASRFVKPSYNQPPAPPPKSYPAARKLTPPINAPAIIAKSFKYPSSPPPLLIRKDKPLPQLPNQDLRNIVNEINKSEEEYNKFFRYGLKNYPKLEVYIKDRAAKAAMQEFNHKLKKVEPVINRFKVEISRIIESEEDLFKQIEEVAGVYTAEYLQSLSELTTMQKSLTDNGRYYKMAYQEAKEKNVEFDDKFDFNIHNPIAISTQRLPRHEMLLASLLKVLSKKGMQNSNAYISIEAAIKKTKGFTSLSDFKVAYSANNDSIKEDIKIIQTEQVASKKFIQAEKRLELMANEFLQKKKEEGTPTSFLLRENTEVKKLDLLVANATKLAKARITLDDLEKKKGAEEDKKLRKELIQVFQKAIQLIERKDFQFDRLFDQYIDSLNQMADIDFQKIKRIVNPEIEIKYIVEQIQYFKHAAEHAEIDHEKRKNIMSLIQNVELVQINTLRRIK